MISALPPVAAAAPTTCATDLFFSEYIEGSGNNKALEIYNGTGSSINLGSYTIELYTNGSTTAGSTQSLSGTIAAGDVYVIANSSANAAILNVADITSSVTFFNGNDAILLKKNGAVIDVIGQLGTDPGSQWGSGSVTTKEHTIVRKDFITGGDTNPNDAYSPANEYDGYAQDTTSFLGSHTMDCNGGGGGSCSTIPEIQGSGTASTCLGVRNNIAGCITGVASGGFYMQDVAGDGDPATSDAIYVYGGFGWTNPNNLAVGDAVSVSGTIIEFFDTTEFAGDQALTVSVTGSCTVPAPISISPLTSPNIDPDTVYEQYEGMRVQMTIDGWVTGATKRFQSNNIYGDPEIAFVDFSSSIPDYSRVFEMDYPGYQGLNYISGALNQDLPDLDFGDDIGGTNITGILGYSFDKFQLMIEAPTTFTTVDNPDVTDSQPPVDTSMGEFDICFYNVENLFDNIDDGNGDWGDWAPGYPTSGSAAGAAIYNAKLAELAGQITSDMQSCMVIGLAEAEGEQKIYDALAAAVSSADAAHSWSAGFTESGDARDISQGFLWRNDVTILGSVLGVDGAPYSGWVADNSLDFRRVPATAEFRFNAGTANETDIHVYANHFKSKRSSSSCSTDDCTDLRMLEAADLRDILKHHDDAGEYAIGGGDLNDTLGSDPINILDAGSADIKNMYDDLPASNKWSFVFSGESEVLDYMFVTQSLINSAWYNVFGPIHVNADFPSAERVSDHDPVRIRFSKTIPTAVEMGAVEADNTTTSSLTVALTLTLAIVMLATSVVVVKRSRS